MSELKNHRENKKLRTRRRILENAVALFRKEGIRATRTARIAEASDISPATLFNYFQTKDELAESWVRGEVREEISSHAEALATRGLRPGMRAICRTLAEISSADRRLRAEAWRCAGRARDADARVAFPGLVHALQADQNRERVRKDVEAAELADMLVDAIEGGLVTGLSRGLAARELGQVLRAHVDLVLDGARKRNERVSISAAAGAKRAAVPPA